MISRVSSNTIRGYPARMFHRVVTEPVGKKERAELDRRRAPKAPEIKRL